MTGMAESPVPGGKPYRELFNHQVKIPVVAPLVPQSPFGLPDPRPHITIIMTDGNISEFHHRWAYLERDRCPVLGPSSTTPMPWGSWSRPPWPDEPSRTACCPFPTPVARRLLVCLALGTVLMTSCRGQEPARVDWDLSTGHTVADVDFPRPDLTSTEVAPIESARIRLPGGRVFTGGEELERIFLTREGNQITEMLINTKPMTTDEAYQLAVRRAGEWGLPREPLDKWHSERLAQRQRGEENLDSTVQSSRSGANVGEGGPVPSLEILASFVDDKPSIVSVSFFWDADREAPRDGP